MGVPQRRIYNSRNSKDLIVISQQQPVALIYNSRNSKDLIVLHKKVKVGVHLQQ